MSMQRLLLGALLVCGGLFAASGAARAAESYDNCAGYIDSVPATISTQGVWCLRKNVSTNMSSGIAILIDANNVTIDCNDFKIGGLGGGANSETVGIRSYGRQNATIRNCNIRGFFDGIYLNDGAGHLVEDNRLDNNSFMGIYVMGDNSLVRRNRIYDTGGNPGRELTHGIYASADVIDNIISGVFAATEEFDTPHGITLYGNGYEVSGNHVSNLSGDGGSGIYTYGDNITLNGNRVIFGGTATMIFGSGIYGEGANTFCTNNTVTGFVAAYSKCEHTFGNLPTP